MEGKRVIVTGASSGIGFQTVKRFVERGARVVACGRDKAALGLLRDECFGFDGSIRMHLADLRETSQIEKLVSDSVEAFDGIDTLVNSAGIIGNGTIESASPEDWDEMMGINLRSVFLLTQHAIPFLKINRGSVVNVSSVAGPRAFPNLLAYCVSKAGIDQMTRCAALDLAEYGIRVNAVNPGVVVSNLHKRSGMDEKKYADFLEHSKSTHPLGRVGRPEEVADLILYLSSDAASWITGGTFEIDGGRAQTCAR